MNASARRIPAGIHKARAIAGSAQYGQTSNHNDQIVIELELIELGLSVSSFLVFSEKSASYSIRKLRAAGWKGNDLSNLEGLGSTIVPVEVRYEVYNGEEKMKVDIQTGASVVLDQTLDDKAKRAFAARFKDMAALVPPVSGQAAATPSQGSPNSFGTVTARTQKGVQQRSPEPSGPDYSNDQGGDDDIPF